MEATWQHAVCETMELLLLQGLSILELLQALGFLLFLLFPGFPLFFLLPASSFLGVGKSEDTLEGLKAKDSPGYGSAPCTLLMVVRQGGPGRAGLQATQSPIRVRPENQSGQCCCFPAGLPLGK